MVLASEFCVHHSIELSFITALKENALIEIVLVDDQMFLPTSQLTRLEKIVRLHFELDINLEGIETIIHLLDRIQIMQEDITRLSNRLRAYEVASTGSATVDKTSSATVDKTGLAS
jgi:chaperone modulatory protein CbpM